MAFGSFSESDSGADIAEINMIPLIDVMLVLLVIFIVTAPLLTHAVKVARIMSEAARHGLARLGFVTAPAAPAR